MLFFFCCFCFCCCIVILGKNTIKNLCSVSFSDINSKIRTIAIFCRTNSSILYIIFRGVNHLKVTQSHNYIASDSLVTIIHQKAAMLLTFYKTITLTTVAHYINISDSHCSSWLQDNIPVLLASFQPQGTFLLDRLAIVSVGCPKTSVNNHRHSCVTSRKREWLDYTTAEARNLAQVA